MNEVGVGIMYFQGFEDFLASHASLIDVIEVEPQTFWYDHDLRSDTFVYDHNVTDFLSSYPRPKLFHGVGYPVGGTYIPPARHFNTLRLQAEQVNPEWISEHLSFNIFSEAGKEINSGFLLPPLQTIEGVNAAVANIINYRSETGRPFAFETGVNYLQRLKGEMSDGLFVRKVAEQADCNILLDLHNILTNARNGRQSVKDFLHELPLDRVIELHVAGGTYYKDYYLDAHSGVSDGELMEILEHVVTLLPNLKALIFEIAPYNFMDTPRPAIVSQLTKMKRIWDRKGKHNKQALPGKAAEAGGGPLASVSVGEWERSVGNLVLGREGQSSIGSLLAEDRGISIIKDLVFNFRGSVLISTLKLSTRLLRLTVGEEQFNDHITAFFDTTFPELLPVVAAGQFEAFIKSTGIIVPHLDKMLEYELATIRTAIDKQRRTISFDFDPSLLIVSLVNGELPAELPAGINMSITIGGDADLVVAEIPLYNPVVHN